MTAGRRRWLWLAAAALLVAGLAGGRALAVETVERAWAGSLGMADVYLDARALALLMRLAVLALAIGWGTAHLFVVYRAIGSVQMPRRLGDLEIVETVPRWALRTATIASGVVFGLVLTWGTGEWWLAAALAGAAPVFGVTDPVLHRDAGYYVGALPWAATIQDHVLIAVVTVGAVVTLLYYGMGSLRRVDGEWRTSPYARTHLGVLLACGAAALAWGAALDPAEVVAGLHGPVHQATLDFRVAGAPLVAVFAAATAATSLIWAGFGRARLLTIAWILLGAASLLVYTLLPGMGRSAQGPAGARVPALDSVRPALEALAFGPRGTVEPLAAPPSLEAAIASVPLWDPPHVAAAAHRRAEAGSRATVHPAGVALAGARQWLVAPSPDDAALRLARPAPTWSEVHRGAWARTGPALLATETDTGLAFRPVPDAEPELWFGHDFTRYAVAAPESTFAAAVTGIPLEGLWRRAALAWVLQSAELSRGAVAGQRLLWRRDVTERLGRLAPFAAFETPIPVLVEGAVWWASYGYVRSATFPLVPAATVDGRRVRYARAGLMGLVRGATGETRLFRMPDGDSLTAAWARAFAPLVQPWDSVPAGLRGRLPFPAQAFALAADRWRLSHGDTAAWTRRPNAPYHLLVPPQLWTAQGFDAGAPPRVVAVLAGAMTPRGPALSLWRPEAGVRLPPPVLGAPHLRAGPERLWPVEGVLFALQAQFEEPTEPREPPRLRGAWVSWGDRAGAGSTAPLALRDLLAAGAREPPSAERWEEARRLLAQADSALAAGDVERFGRLYAALKQALAVGRRPLAPPGRPR